MQSHVAVVEMGGDAQAGVAHGPQRQCGVVEVDEIGLIPVDEIDRAIVELVAIGLVREAGAVVPVPLAKQGVRVGAAGAARVVLRVEVLRVEAVPPLALAVGLGELAVVGHAGERAGLVRALRRLVPRPGVRGVHADAEPQAVRARGLGPAADQVLLRADGDRVPRLVLAVPEVEIVVVVGQREEILGARPLVERHELLRIPPLRLPEMDDVLEAELRG